MKHFFKNILGAKNATTISWGSLLILIPALAISTVNPVALGITAGLTVIAGVSAISSTAYQTKYKYEERENELKAYEEENYTDFSQQLKKHKQFGKYNENRTTNFEELSRPTANNKYQNKDNDLQK